jgi:hypothetical protein
VCANDELEQLNSAACSASRQPTSLSR